MKCRRGDVVILFYPDSNLQTGKHRPALVVQADNLSSGLAQTIVAMITSNPKRSGHKSRVSISHASDEGRKSGLRFDSLVMTDNLTTVLDNEIARVIGRLPSMDAVDAALRHTLAL
jgi:mRNA interferase MazF